jgi:hypothetical protein
MPWARTVPLLALGLFILTAASGLRAVVRFEDTSFIERVLLALFVILLLAASASNPPRHETRYVFFLYPLAIIFSIITLQRAVRALLGQTRIAAVTAALACIAAFMLSEDFRPAHLWNIDTELVNFRIGMSGRLAGHYHPRSDVRAAATWLQAHALPGDIVIDSFPGVDFYYGRSDFYFVAETDPRFEVWSCRRGTTQRWSNLPMIHSYDTLLAKAATGRRVWMVLESGRMQGILARFPPGAWTLEWTSRARDIAIVQRFCGAYRRCLVKSGLLSPGRFGLIAGRCCSSNAYFLTYVQHGSMHRNKKACPACHEYERGYDDPYARTGPQARSLHAARSAGRAPWPRLGISLAKMAS